MYVATSVYLQFLTNYLKLPRIVTRGLLGESSGENVSTFVYFRLTDAILKRNYARYQSNQCTDV
jgi:hypothetical protein